MYTREELEKLVSNRVLIDYILRCQDRIRVFVGCIFSCKSKTGDCKKYLDDAKEYLASFDKNRGKSNQKEKYGG